MPPALPEKVIIRVVSGTVDFVQFAVFLRERERESEKNTVYPLLTNIKNNTIIFEGSPTSPPSHLLCKYSEQSS